MRAMYTLIPLVTLLYACSTETGSKGDTKRSDSGGEGGEDGEIGDPATQDPKDKSKKAKRAITVEPADGKGEGDDADDPDGGDTDDALTQLLEDCGVDPAGGGGGVGSLAFERNVTSLPIIKTVSDHTIESSVKLKANITNAKTVFSTDVTITSVAGPFKSIAEGKAKDAAAAKSGTTTFENVAFAKYQDLGKDKQWEGILCTLVPVNAVVNVKGGKTTKAKFTPAIPILMSPKAVAERYASELGDGKVMKDITVDIESSEAPELKDKKKLVGTITIEKIANELSEAANPGAGKTEVSSDLAYKVTYSFGTPDETFALGLTPESRFYIDHETKNIKASVVDTSKVKDGSKVYFLEK